MRVAFTTDHFWPGPGGVQNVVREVSSRLAHRGHDVSIVTLRPSTRSPPASWEGIPVHHVPGVSLRAVTGLDVTFPSRPWLAGHLRNVDVVSAHNMFFGTTLAAALARRVPLATTLHVHGFDEAGPVLSGAARAFEATAGRWVLGRSDAVVAVSQRVADRARGRVEPARMRVIPNAVDTHRFQPNGHRKASNVLFVGRLTRNKGPHELLAAFEQVQRSHPDADLHFVGDGPLQASLARRAQRKSLRVRFTRRAPDIATYLQEAAVYARPSLSDGLPLTVLEAMACATPVVSYDVGGTREVLDHGREGWLVPTGDVSGLAERIVGLLNDPARGTAMGAAGRTRTLQGPTWDDVARAYERVLEDLVKP